MFISEFLIAAFSLTTILFWSSFNPISLCLLLIFSSLILGLALWSVGSKWIGISLILVFAGGMMISFLYVSSLAFNQKITMSPSNLYWIALVMTPPLFWSKPLFLAMPFFPIISFSNSFSPLMTSLIVYLLATLFFVVKISESFKGALTQKF